MKRPLRVAYSPSASDCPFGPRFGRERAPRSTSTTERLSSPTPKPCSHAWTHTMADESFLDLLPSHPIFTTPGPASSSSDSSISQGRTLVVVRNADLIVWTKGELRMTGLVDCKSNKKLGYKVS